MEHAGRTSEVGFGTEARDVRPRKGPSRLALRGAGLLGLVSFLTLAAGCAVEPWVKPYERDRIADPIMSWDRDPVSSAYMHHVYEAREGARGATGSAGGGCGCN